MIYNLYQQFLKFELNRRIMEYNLKFCEDAIPDLIKLTVKITDMGTLEIPGLLQENKKLYDALLLHKNDSVDYSSIIEYDDYDVLSENSETGKVNGCRNL